MIVVLTLAISCFGNLYAQGVYIGAGLGNTFYGSEVENLDEEVANLDENATAWLASSRISGACAEFRLGRRGFLHS